MRVCIQVCVSQRRSEVMVVMTDVTLVLGAVLSLPADARKHLKEFCPLISGLLGAIQGNKGGKKKMTLASMETSLK